MKILVENAYNGYVVRIKTNKGFFLKENKEFIFGLIKLTAAFLLKAVFYIKKTIKKLMMIIR